MGCIKEESGPVALPLPPHSVRDSKGTQTATFPEPLVFRLYIPFPCGSTVSGGRQPWLAGICLENWHTGLCARKAATSQGDTESETGPGGMLCGCEGWDWQTEASSGTGGLGLGLCLQGGRSQMGWVLKAQWKGIYLILISQRLREGWFDTCGD